MQLQNPILKGFNPDPSICRVDDDFYIAVSTFEWYPGVLIYHSKNLIDWKIISRPLDNLEMLNMVGNPDSGGVWAPCLSYSDNKFWLIFSDVKVVEHDVFKDLNNYVTTCDKIDGKWTKPVYLNSSGFDPSLFHDINGKKYLLNMVWDHRPKNHRFYGIQIQEYDSVRKKLVGEKRIIFKGTELGLTEAPHLYYVDGYYYLVVAEGGTGYEHAVTIARSKNIFGTYEVHPENPILTSWADPANAIQKAGHASLVKTKEGNWYMAHLMGRPLKFPKEKLLENRGYCPLGRETSLQQIKWKNNWPYVVNGPTPSEKIEITDSFVCVSNEHGDKQEIVNNFEESFLPDHFNTLREPFSEEMGSLTERKGFLRLYGRHSPHSLFHQSLVARRWQSFCFEAETYIEFSPKSHQQFAGLICYYNTQNWVSLNVTFDEKTGKILTILKCDMKQVSAPLEDEEITIPQEKEGIYLKVCVDNLYFKFKYSFDGIKWHNINRKFESYKLSDDYNDGHIFFTGAFVGIHAVDLSGDKIAADFGYFKYKEK